MKWISAREAATKTADWSTVRCAEEWRLVEEMLAGACDETSVQRSDCTIADKQAVCYIPCDFKYSTMTATALFAFPCCPPSLQCARTTAKTKSCCAHTWLMYTQGMQHWQTNPTWKVVQLFHQDLSSFPIFARQALPSNTDILRCLWERRVVGSTRGCSGLNTMLTSLQGSTWAPDKIKQQFSIISKQDRANEWGRIR